MSSKEIKREFFKKITKNKIIHLKEIMCVVIDETGDTVASEIIPLEIVTTKKGQFTYNIPENYTGIEYLLGRAENIVKLNQEL